MKMIMSGERLHLLCSLLSLNCPKFSQFKLTSDSYFDPWFEKIEKQFRKNFIDGFDIGSCLAIYYKGKIIVDIAAGYKGEKLTKFYLRKNIQPVT